MVKYSVSEILSICLCVGGVCLSISVAVISTHLFHRMVEQVEKVGQVEKVEQVEQVEQVEKVEQVEPNCMDFPL